MTTHRGLFRGETLSEALGVYLSATAICRLIGLARNILLTWLMFDASEFGLFALALVVINVLQPVCSLGLNEAVTRYTPTYETRGMLKGFLRRAVVLVCSVSAAISWALLYVSGTLGDWVFATTGSLSVARTMHSHPTTLMQSSAWCAFTVVIYYLALCVLKGLRMFRAISLMELVSGVVFTALAVIVVLNGHGTAVAVVACYMMSMWVALACLALPASLSIASRGEDAEPIHDEPVIRRMLAFSLWAAAAAVLWQAMQSYPLWYLNRVHGGGPTGVLGAVRTLTQYVSVASVAVVTVVMTMVTKLWESEGRESADRLLALTFKLTNLLLLTCCVIMSVFRHEVAMLFHPSFRTGAGVIPLSLVSFIIVGNMGFLAIHFNLIEKTRFLFWPWAIGLGGTVLLSFLLVPQSGASGGVMRWGGILRPLVNYGMGDPIGSVSWAGALGMVGSMVTCLVLLRIEHRPVDIGTQILLWGAGILVLPGVAMVPAIGVLWLLVVRTDVIFNSREKLQIAAKHAQITGWWRDRRTT